MSWIIVFKTKAPRGNLVVDHGLRFSDGVLKIKDDTEKATLLLTRQNRGIDYEVDRVEGDLPSDLVTMVEESPFGTYTAETSVPHHPEREMVKSFQGVVPPAVGVDVVEGQPEGPEEIEVAELIVEEEKQEEVPAVEVVSVDDLFLLDRPGLESFAKGIEVDAPADFRNDDTLIEAILAKLEADGRVGADGVITEKPEIPEHVAAPEVPESVEFQIPTKKALEEMNFESVVSFALELVKERGAEIPPESFKTKGKLVKALLKLEE